MNIIDQISGAATHSPFKCTCDQVLSSDDPYSRSTKAGHITASGLVIKDGKALLIFHPHLKRWFQPGGHIDEGETPIEAAIREVFEETGVTCRTLVEHSEPIDIDLHEIPANPKKGEDKHLHIDLLFLLEMLKEGDSMEAMEKAWVPFEKITNTRLRRTIDKLQSVV
ncbi:NUDIX hydrolase [Polynucleobacter arcticus]|uniref:NUDIX hydrolase n=1 Tax=Polynucleobacter arcticus TaxID=1743165 RepID=UPI001570B23D|nr:NUDIX domain-containing protein [Polynucleobacter arcticus]